MANISLSVPGQSTNNADSHLQALMQVLNHFHPISNEAAVFLKKHVHPCSFRRGKLLLKAGDICGHVYFIKKGVVRGYIREGVRDITTWITAEGEMVTSISALDKQEPSKENMQALEDCEMLSISFTDLQSLYERYNECNITVRKLLQQYYMDAEGRAFIARLTNAENKYKLFLERYEHLANRVPLKYIASFLGITLETLSRVRKKLSTKG